MTTPTVLLESWLKAEPDPANRQAMEAGRRHPEWVQEHFGSVLRFGTAGMRASTGPGPTRMNRVMARIAARAVGAELIASGLGGRGAVVGFDARPGSSDMALDAARLLAGLGIPTAIIDGPAPTPLLARQMLARSAGAGLMITASHNHRDDNGLKVYWADGTQIRPPLDRRIEARMDLSSLPDDGDLAARHEIESLNVRSVIAEYVGAVVRRPVFDENGRPVDPNDVPPMVYTALCGVGAETLGHAFAAAGLPPVTYVEHQRHPDGSFRGLPYPNPEEPGTLDDATSLADERCIDLVMANDPDADRLAVAVRDKHGSWRRLSGDELGVLLCDWLIELATRLGDETRAKPTGEPASGEPASRKPSEKPAFGEPASREPAFVSASSVVSATMVAALCRTRGVAHHRTLTGFKWIMMPRLQHRTARWLFGYEEALGYSVTDAVLDKDGISAAVEFARLVGALAGRGIGPLERLDELSAEIGLHVTAATSVRANADVIAAVMTHVRTHRPSMIAGRAVTRFTDWLDSSASHPADLVELTLSASPTANGDNQPADADVRICIRPSGTEPKAKIYLEAISPNVSADPVDIGDQRRHLRSLLNEIADDIAASLFPDP